MATDHLFKSRPFAARLQTGVLASKWRLHLFVAVLLGINGRTDATAVSVENRSGIPLRSVVVTSSGFTETLGDLGPGATARAQVRPSGESSLDIVFVASGRKVALDLDTYFEASGSYVA